MKNHFVDNNISLLLLPGELVTVQINTMVERYAGYAGNLVIYTVAITIP